MAKKVETRFVDDLDGSEAVGTTTFAFDGVSYEIDLSDANYQRFAQAVGEFIGAGRKISSGPRRRRSSGSAPARSEEPNKMREWARENGYTVSDRGRVSQQVRKAYLEAHGQA